MNQHNPIHSAATEPGQVHSEWESLSSHILKYRSFVLRVQRVLLVSHNRNLPRGLGQFCDRPRWLDVTR